MKKENAYPRPRSSPISPEVQSPEVQGTPSYDVPKPKDPGAWEAFKGGLESVNKYRSPRLKSQEWADLRLTRQQWLEKYPNATPKDYFNWRQSIQRRRKDQSTNWFQRAIWPLHRFIPR